MSGSDPIDRAAQEFTNGHALKFAVPDDEALASAARSALDYMRTLLRKRPALGAAAPSSTGRILRDYHMALRAGDRSAADRHLRTLEAGFRLDPVNLLYLRVQAHAEFGEWEALLALPELGDLLALRRPVAVTQALLTAVYRTRLAQFESPENLQAAVAAFRSEIYPRYASLFTSRAGLREVDAQKLFVLFAVAGPAPSVELRDQILAELSHGRSGTDFVRRLGGLLPASATPVQASEPALARAERAAHHGQYDEAFGIAVGLPASLDRARVLLDSAYGLGSIDAAKVALEALGDLDHDGRASVLADRRRKDAHSWLLAQAPSAGADPDGAIRLPGNWFEWLEAIDAHPNWSQAAQFARRGAAEWAFDNFLNDDRGPTEFARRLSAGCASEPVKLALPHLLDFFQSDPSWPRRELAPVYQSMVEILVFTAGIGDEDLTVFHQLAEAVLSLGDGVHSYATLVGYAQDLLRDYSAATRIDWALDMLDLFIAAECPAPDLRVSFAVAVAGALQKYSRRVSTTQRDFFADLCDELGHRELIPQRTGVVDADYAEQQADPLTRLGRRSVAVYTLTESAGQRFAEVLERRCPSVVVETNHDYVATDQLRHLARNADIFVMVTGSAKHAATLFIQSQRPADRALLRPAGKGSASMLRAVREYAATL
jgi:hypothetical protein